MPAGSGPTTVGGRGASVALGVPAWTPPCPGPATAGAGEGVRLLPHVPSRGGKVGTARPLSPPTAYRPCRLPRGRGAEVGRPNRELPPPPIPVPSTVPLRRAGKRPLLTTPTSTGPATPGSSWSRPALAPGSAARRGCPPGRRRRRRDTAALKGIERTRHRRTSSRPPPCSTRPPQEVRARAAAAGAGPARGARGAAVGQEPLGTS